MLLLESREPVNLANRLLCLRGGSGFGLLAGACALDAERTTLTTDCWEPILVPELLLVLSLLLPRSSRSRAMVMWGGGGIGYSSIPTFELRIEPREFLERVLSLLLSL